MQQLEVGNRVSIKCLGSYITCTVIECHADGTYKLQAHDGIIYPFVKWISELPPNHKTPWYIVEYLGNSVRSKSDIYQSTSTDTLQKIELDAAIKEQKKILRRGIK